MSTLDKRYPLSAPDGSTIPFGIGYPLGLIIQPISDVASAPLALPPDAVIAVLFSSCDCVISFGDPSPSASTEEGVLLPLQLFLPAFASVSVQILKSFLSVVSTEQDIDGTLYINLFVPWEGLGKDLLGRRM